MLECRCSKGLWQKRCLEKRKPQLILQQIRFYVGHRESTQHSTEIVCHKNLNRNILPDAQISLTCTCDKDIIYISCPLIINLLCLNVGTVTSSLKDLPQRAVTTTDNPKHHLLPIWITGCMSLISSGSVSRTRYRWVHVIS